MLNQESSFMAPVERRGNAAARHTPLIAPFTVADCCGEDGENREPSIVRLESHMILSTAKLPLLPAPTINCPLTLHVPPGKCFWEGSVLWGRALLRGEPVCWSIGVATHNEAL